MTSKTNVKLNLSDMTDLFLNKIEQHKKFTDKILIKGDILTKSQEKGFVIGIADGVVKIVGLNKVMAGELVLFKKNLFGLALNLEKDFTGIILFGSDNLLQEGDNAFRTYSVLKMPVGTKVLGRVLDGFGNPIDNLGSLNIKKNEYRKVEVKAPGIIPRAGVTEAMLSGILSIDTMVPIGRGQRELIIGDRQTGKTSIAIDIILNQKRFFQKNNLDSNFSKELFCVYVAVGQKRSIVSKIYQKLRAEGSMNYTTIVSATASDPASLQFLAPYSGCAIGE